MPNWLERIAARRSRRRHTVTGIALVLALTGGAVAHFKGAAKSQEKSAIRGGVGSTLGAFRFTDQHGTPVNETSLNGHVWIADFIFTTCTSACPLITSRFVTLQRRLTDDRLRFVSFSVDPARDTQSALAQYAERWAPHESRWQLLRTNDVGLGSLLAGLHVALGREDGELIHTSRSFLIDAHGALVESYDSADDEALERLASRARELLGLAKEAAGGTPIAGQGAELFSSLGCAGCHADPQLAPPLGGLSGTHVMLERAGSVPVDDAYLAESIADASAQLVSGYPNSMPNYGPLLSAQQLQSLVRYVRSLRADPKAEGTDAASAQTDPVCGMAVRVTPHTPSAAYQGKTYHFCSAACSQRFSANPHRYLAGQRAAP